MHKSIRVKRIGDDSRLRDVNKILETKQIELETAVRGRRKPIGHLSVSEPRKSSGTGDTR